VKYFLLNHTSLTFNMFICFIPDWQGSWDVSVHFMFSQ